MVAKCANPTCSASFRYLHEGKLFVMEAVSGQEANGELRSPSSKTLRDANYYWLCGRCCHNLTIARDHKGIKVIPCKDGDCCRKIAS